VADQAQPERVGWPGLDRYSGAGDRAGPDTANPIGICKPYRARIMNIAGNRYAPEEWQIERTSYWVERKDGNTRPWRSMQTIVGSSFGWRHETTTIIGSFESFEAACRFVEQVIHPIPPLQDATDYADTISWLEDFAEGLEAEPHSATTETAVKLREAIALLQTLVGD